MAAHIGTYSRSRSEVGPLGVALTRSWWVLAVRGVLAIALGLAAFVWPALTLGALVLLFGVYAIADGVMALVGALWHRSRDWWLLLAEAGIGIAAGVAAFVWPGLTALILVYLIAAWAIGTGLAELAAAWRLRREIANEWMLAIAGLLSVAFGVVLVARPGAGALAVVWLIGAYAVAFGISLLALALRFRRAAAAARAGSEST